MGHSCKLAQKLARTVPGAHLPHQLWRVASIAHEVRPVSWGRPLIGTGYRPVNSSQVNSRNEE